VSTTQNVDSKVKPAVAHLFYTESYYALINTGRNTNSVTQTMNMDESNGTNLKPIPPILFFNKLMNIGLVIVPSPDCWREWLLGPRTKISSVYYRYH
jgi:hypothetical protein